MSCDSGSNQAGPALCGAGVPDSQRRATWAGDSPLWFSGYDSLSEMDAEIKDCHPGHDDDVATVSFCRDGNSWGRGTVSFDGAGEPGELGVHEVDHDIAVSLEKGAGVLPREVTSPVTIFEVTWEAEDGAQSLDDLADVGRAKLRKQIGRSGYVEPDGDATVQMYPDGKKIVSVTYSWEN